MKISIIGCGKVGSSVAFSMIMKGGPDELILVDIENEMVEGERVDLLHTLPAIDAFPSIRVGELKDTLGSDIIVITAGIPRRPGESRLDLAKKNAKIMKEIIAGLPKGGDPIVFIISNPVDLLTHLVAGSMNPRRVIGLGTFLDTSRFRFYLGEALDVPPSHVNALILGEHGDSMVPIWSHVSVDGIHLREFGDLPDTEKTSIIDKTRQSGALLNKRKGGTNWGVAIATCEVLDTIARDQRRVLPISSLVEDYYGIDGVSLSVPTIISNRGVEEHIKLSFDDEEIRGLMASANILKEAMEEI